jgi:predicted nucleotidyltransferase
MKERVNITIEPELLERIDVAAEREFTSRSALIRRVMRAYLDRATAGEGAASDTTARVRASIASESGVAYRAPAALPDLDETAALLRGFFAARTDVEAAWLFGSLMSQRAGPLSDVDVAVLPKADATDVFDARDVASRLEEALAGRPVDVVVLGRGSTLLGYLVAVEGRLVFGEGVAAAEARLRAVTAHLDFQQVAKAADKRFAEKVSEYDALR